MSLSVSIDSTKDFEVVTEMIQPGVLADIVDKGEVPNKFKPGTTQPKCMFVWILAEEDGSEPGKKFIKVTAVMPLKKGQNAPDIPAGFVRKQDQPAK